MKYTDLLETISIPGQPLSKLDIDNKVYIVYDENGNELRRYPFQHVWDSSPAKRAADKNVSELKAKIRAERNTKDTIAAVQRKFCAAALLITT